MANAPKMCFDRILPRDLARPARLVRGYRPGRDRAISLIGKQWVNGSTISISFLDGTQEQKEMVRSHAPEWTEYANLHFQFTENPVAQIRVTFDASDGAWSYVGTDNLDIPLHAATLNLGWQDEGVILHEFGHMIGLSHEHQNPGGGMQWNEARVIADLQGPPNYWTEAQIRHNVLDKYSADQLHGTEFDPESIMLYAFPADWTTNGFGTEENEELSEMDKEFVRAATMYPRTAGPADDDIVELRVSAATSASIGQAGEVDEFKFEVTSRGAHVIQTTGTTDVFMTLFGPNSKTVKLAENDDSGAGRNALIRADLTPGTYYVQVRHYSPIGMGDYSIAIQR
ncbi:MAG: peptidase [Gemmatimonadetes bacterium]|nr:peptidase [Gemmatimonadota bacterium]